MSTQVHLVTIIENVTLLVFYTDSDCWQFRLISAGGEVFGERKLTLQKLPKKPVASGLIRDIKLLCSLVK
jgi:hypothetical protein